MAILFLQTAQSILLPFDTGVIEFFYRLRTPLLTGIALLFTNIGGAVFIGVASVAVCLILIRKGKAVSAFHFALIIIGGTLLNLTLKYLVQRMRPAIHPIVIETDYSFPSGHAMNSLIFYTSFYLYFLKGRKQYIVPGLLLVLLIGVSRIYLGVHYPSDVLGGYLGGAVWLFFTQKILNDGKGKRQYKKNG